MNDVQDVIVKSLAKISGVSPVEIKLEHPEVESYGDYSTNLALKGETPKGSPSEVAKEWVEKLKEDKELGKVVGKIEVAGPGFINFFISKDALLNVLIQIDRDKESFGSSSVGEGEKVMIEFGQPNTHKLPHIGHLFSYIYGDSLARIMQFAGYEIFRANYQGDIGPHVAKCLWAFQKENPLVPESLKEKVMLLQKMYQKGSMAYSQDEKAKEEIDRLNQDIYARSVQIEKLWQETREWSLDYYRQFEKDMGIDYDRRFLESQVHDEGKKIVLDNLSRVFTKSQGAVIFPGSEYGLHDRVFITKNDTPTYEAKDMYLQTLKNKEWPADLLIITTANEQNDYFKVMFKALETINPDFKGKLKHIGFGMVNLKSGKMSSREGKIISAMDLVETVVAEVYRMISSEKEISDREKETISQKVGIGAVKYSFLKNNPFQDTKFDLKESISKEGNSGPYLQYTHARIASITEKSGLKNSLQGETLQDAYNNWIKNDLPLNDQERGLLATLVRFSDVIEAASKSYSPNLLANYLYDLAQKYNNFYNLHRVIGSDNQEFRLALSIAVGKVIANGLHLLGIEAPSKM